MQRTALSGIVLYWLLSVALIDFAIYTYAVAAFPAFNYTKDLLVVLVAAATLIDAAVTGRLRRRGAGWIDLFASFLFFYLVFELIYTAIRINSLTFAYLGFRLDMAPIVFYFAFRRLRNSWQVRSIRALFIGILTIAVGVTLCEFSLVVSGLIPQSVFWQFVGANPSRADQAVGWVPRVYGMIGTPHITGVCHAVLLAVLLFWPRNGEALPGLGWLDRSGMRSGMILLTLAAIFLSTSKTAWLLVPLIVGLDMIAHRKFSSRAIRRVLALVAASAVLLYLLVYQDPGQRDRVVDELILGTLDLKQEQIGFWTADVLHDSPIIGYGYAYEPTVWQSGAPPRWTSRNGFSSGDNYVVDIVRMFGLAGIALFFVTLGVLPLRTLFLRHSSLEQQGAALGVLAVLGAFAHYSPLTHPLMGLTLWYSLAIAAGTRVRPRVRVHNAVTLTIDSTVPKLEVAR